MFILCTRLQSARDVVLDFRDQNEILLDVVAAGLRYHNRSRIPIPGTQLDGTGGTNK